jgi:hypothetical protein
MPSLRLAAILLVFLALSACGQKSPSLRIMEGSEFSPSVADFSFRLRHYTLNESGQPQSVLAATQGIEKKAIRSMQRLGYTHVTPPGAGEYTVEVHSICYDPLVVYTTGMSELKVPDLKDPHYTAGYVDSVYSWEHPSGNIKTIAQICNANISMVIRNFEKLQHPEIYTIKSKTLECPYAVGCSFSACKDVVAVELHDLIEQYFSKQEKADSH